ncbi:MAG: type IV toxin-antitoxin system AbiEi family antitoxin domain-containing protein, partial [Actinomycetes bacterium]
MQSFEDPEAALAMQHMLANGGGASSADLRRWGISRAAIERMLRRGQISRQSRGRYHLPSPASGDRWSKQRSEHLMAAAALSGQDRVLGLRTAA